MRPGGIAMTNVWTSSGRVKPGSTCRIATNVRIISPETISNVRANATCPTTSALRVRCRPGASLADRPPSLSAVMLGLPNRRTANRPNSTPLSTETDNVNSKTVTSIPMSSTRGSSAGAIVRSSPVAAWASATPTRTAGECQHHALRQQRARDAATTRPKRRTHGEFLMPSFRAHQEQVRHVPAGDEQHDADGGQENPQDLPDVADHVIGQRAHVRLQLQSRKGRREKRDHARHIGVGLGQRDARLQPGERLKPEADSAGRVDVQRHRQHDVGTGAQKLERRGQHADHFARPAIDHERLADDVLGTTEPALPIAIGQNHPQRIARRIVFGTEEPTDRRVGRAAEATWPR